MSSLTLRVRFATRCLALSHNRVFSRSLSTTRGLLQEAIAKDTSSTVEPVDSTKISDFYEKGIISKQVFNALSRLNFENFTAVQSKTIGPLTVGEKGIIARAKTGTGKTLAFGLPLIEKAIKRDPRSKGVIGLIIAPTRDLAYQIRDELLKVISLFPRTSNHINVQCLVGAEPKHQQIRAFTRSHTFPQIVVATPGRLYDMLENPMIQRALSTIEYKVLDEADRLLDDGFKDSLLDIESAIRDLKSQNNTPVEKTLLFSATIDENVLGFAEDIMGKDLNYIDCVDKNAPETHEKVEQSLIATENMFQSFVAASLFIENEAKTNNASKLVVFLPTVKAVSYYKETLQEYLNTQQARIPVFELHGKLSQSQRDRSVRQFRERSKGVLVTSDVGARGMDFPGVTNVVQIGVPTDTTNYVHRIGRTARGGKSGQALLILTQAESSFVKVLLKRKINITKQYAYEPIEESEAAITEASINGYHKYDPDQTIESLCGFYNGVANKYRMTLPKLLGEISSSYGLLVGEPQKLPSVGRNLWSAVLGLSPREAEYYFNTKGSFGRGENNFGRSFNRGVENSYGSNTFSDNNSRGGFSRGGNSRGGNSRGFSRRNSGSTGDDDGIPSRGRYYNNSENTSRFPAGSDSRNRRRGGFKNDF